MRILKVKSKEYKGKVYYKYRINIPAKILEEANLKPGDLINAKVEENKIIIEKIEEKKTNIEGNQDVEESIKQEEEKE